MFQIKKKIGGTKHGINRRQYTKLDFEKLPWVQWLNVEPISMEQRKQLNLVYPILMQEIHSKNSSQLLHFLVGRGVLFWQDVVIIKHQRQTDLERNGPLLKILLTRGKEGIKALVDGLRSRYGAWQGYLADILEMKCNNRTIRGLFDVLKIVCHDLSKCNPVGWSALPRQLGVNIQQIEMARRQNKLACNQLFQTLLQWIGMQKDEIVIMSELTEALHKIGRSDIASGLALLLLTANPSYHKLQNKETSEDSQQLPTQLHNDTGVHCENKTTLFPEVQNTSCQVGNLYEFGFYSHNSKLNRKCSASILQFDHLTQQAYDNFFVDYVSFF